jgi:hypothetical protein
MLGPMTKHLSEQSLAFYRNLGGMIVPLVTVELDVIEGDTGSGRELSVTALEAVVLGTVHNWRHRPRSEVVTYGYEQPQ